MHHEREQHAKNMRYANGHQRRSYLAETVLDKVAHGLRAGDENPERYDRVDPAYHQERHALVVEQSDQRSRRGRFGRQVEFSHSTQDILALRIKPLREPIGGIES
jgi:hypothetical protein